MFPKTKQPKSVNQYITKSRNADLDQFCIGYSETEYELLLNKIYGLSFGILIFVIFGLIAYYWRQIVNFCCCKNNLVLLVVHQNNQPKLDSDEVERGGGGGEVEEEIHSSLFLGVPGNGGGPCGDESRRSSMVSSQHSPITKSVSRNNSFSRNSMTRLPSYNLIRTHSSRRSSVRSSQKSN